MDEKCYCGANKLLSSCCGKTKVKPIKINLENTHHSNLECYANILNNCCGKITKEHYFPQSILKYLANGTNGVKIAGLQFQKNKQKYEKLPPSALTTKILCKTHNNNLSPLDEELCRFFSLMDKINKGLANKNICQRLNNQGTKFSAYDLERALLKICFGRFKNDKFNNVNELLEILFSGTPWANNCGLFFAENSEFHHRNGIEISPNFDKNEKLIFTEFRINNMLLVLLFDSSVNLSDYYNGIKFFKPKGIKYTGIVSFQFDFYWDKDILDHNHGIFLELKSLSQDYPSNFEDWRKEVNEE